MKLEQIDAEGIGHYLHPPTIKRLEKLILILKKQTEVQQWTNLISVHRDANASICYGNGRSISIFKYEISTIPLLIGDEIPLNLFAPSPLHKFKKSHLLWKVWLLSNFLV